MKINFSSNEDQLLNRIRNGDDRAMEKVYLKYRGEFISWSISKYDVSRDDALDHYQDTLTIFFEKVINGSINEMESTIKTYLFGIGKNRIRQQFDVQSKKEKHASSLSEHYTFLSQNSEAADSFELARQNTLDAFNFIGEQCKQLLKLFYYEKKSMSVIANILGHKNEGVSRTTKKRCLEKIREQIKHPKK